MKILLTKVNTHMVVYNLLLDNIIEWQFNILHHEIHEILHTTIFNTCMVDMYSGTKNQ